MKNYATLWTIGTMMVVQLTMVIVPYLPHNFWVLVPVAVILPWVLVALSSVFLGMLAYTLHMPTVAVDSLRHWGWMCATVSTAIFLTA